MSSPNAADLLAAYDAQLRPRVPVVMPKGMSVERDGPAVRLYGGMRGVVDYRDLGGLHGAELDAFIARQRDAFAARREAVIWRTRGHDEPADLADRLLAAGFVPEDRATVLVGRTADVAAEPALPPGVTLRQVSDPAGLDRIAATQSAVYAADWSGLAGYLAGILSTEPDGVEVFAVEASGETVCTAWTRYATGTDFAFLLGGATLPRWRGRGLYRATIAHRARLALGRGFPLLEVEASEDSRPVLERVGLTAVTTTTPYVWTPGTG